MRSVLSIVALCLLTLLSAGCATIPPDAGKNPADPWEVYNRNVAEFNDRADQYVLRPVARGYIKVVPEPARDCIGNVFRNFGDVGNAINNLLQGKVAEAGSDICRVALNTTVGLLGCFDVATRVGLTRSNEDFGQTFGRWGVAPGPYFVIPLLGPSTVRDSVGIVANIYTDPISFTNWSIGWQVTAWTLRFIDVRAGLLDATALLEGAALDKYQFIRDGYLQRRRNLIYDGNPPQEKEPDEPPEDTSEKDSPPAKPPDASGNSPPKAESKDEKPPAQPDQPVPAPAR
ncbi:MAG TPA: MlaA family lipoprotein [Burkholderiaceae bacterium]|nr:MlaA family lipoprotein [Burkholderiaceae bacterium]